LLATIYSFVIHNLTLHIHCTSSHFENNSQLSMADIESRQCPTYEIKSPLKQGAVDKSFLIDTVRHISSYVEF